MPTTQLLEKKNNETSVWEEKEEYLNHIQKVFTKGSSVFDRIAKLEEENEKQNQQIEKLVKIVGKMESLQNTVLKDIWDNPIDDWWAECIKKKK